MGEAFVTPAADPGSTGPEIEIARDLAKHALWIFPVVVVLGFLVWGPSGAMTTGFALALVVFNFGLAAFMNDRAAKISYALLGGVAMFGFLLRISVVFVAFWLTKGADWMKVVPFGLTVVITHLGLLFWEMKFVSATLAFPGLKPSPHNPSAVRKES